MNVKKLEEVCDFISGLWTGKKPPYVSVGVIRNTNFHKNGNLDFSDIAQLEVEVKQFSTRQLKFGDIVLEKSGGGPKQPVGRVCVFEKEDGLYSLSNFTSAIRVKNTKELNYKYLHYYLKHLYIAGETEKIQTHSTGIRNLQLSLYKNFLVPLPPLSTQHKIVAKLDAIFAEIDKATAAAEANARNAEALFQSYLTQVFERAGEGWTETTLEKVCKITNGSTPKRDKKDFWENGDICWFTVDDIRKSGRILSETIQHVTKAALAYTSLKVLPADSVLICCTASIGEYAIIKKPMATNQQFNGLTVIDKNLLPDFLFWYAASMKPLLLSVSGKVTIDFIPISRLKSLPIKFPKVDQQLILIDKLKHISNYTGISKQAFESKVVELQRLKQSILKQAYAGELVKE